MRWAVFFFTTTWFAQSSRAIFQFFFFSIDKLYFLCYARFFCTLRAKAHLVSTRHFVFLRTRREKNRVSRKHVHARCLKTRTGERKKIGRSHHTFLASRQRMKNATENILVNEGKPRSSISDNRYIDRDRKKKRERIWSSCLKRSNQRETAWKKTKKTSIFNALLTRTKT